MPCSRNSFSVLVIWMSMALFQNQIVEAAPNHAGKVQIEQAAQELRKSYPSDDSVLFTQPADEVIPALILVLRESNGSLAQAPEARGRAYSVLHQRYSKGLTGVSPATAAMALEQLLTGLSEPDYAIRATCAGALGWIPPADRPAVVPALVKALRERLPASDEESKRDEVRFIGAAVRTLGAFGPAAESALPDIRQLFYFGDVDQRIRRVAGNAMINIRGIESVIQELLGNDKLEPQAERAARGVLALWLVKTEESNKPEESLRRSIQQRVRAGLKDPDPQARNEAFELMGPAYVHDLLVQDAKGEWVVNSEFLAAIEEMAASDPDPTIRARAQRALDDKGTLKQNLLLRRERAAAP